MRRIASFVLAAALAATAAGAQSGAAKYRGDAGAAARLAAKVKDGGFVLSLN